MNVVNFVKLIYKVSDFCLDAFILKAGLA